MWADVLLVQHVKPSELEVTCIIIYSNPQTACKLQHHVYVGTCSNLQPVFFGAYGVHKLRYPQFCEFQGDSLEKSESEM